MVLGHQFMAVRHEEVVRECIENLRVLPEEAEELVD